MLLAPLVTPLAWRRSGPAVFGSGAPGNSACEPSYLVERPPPSRWGAVGWSDANSNLWLYGGWGYGSSTTDPTGFLDDIWEYQHSSGQWIWWKGISNANQNTVFATQSIPFALGAFYVNNVVGGRRGAAMWPPAPLDPFGFVTVFGGEGYDASQGSPPGYLNDSWTYLPFPN